MKALDTYAFPLVGASLIEASAGTGKTYTIVNLYLRLLLGHHSKIGALGVEQILVVTFTNAATAELKHRVGERIQKAYLDFFAGASDDPFIQQLIDDSADRITDCERLSLASKQMDEASVFTIHSFCQRMLSEYAFESGSAFGEQLELDQSLWVKQATQDFWRNQIVPLDSHAINVLRQLWATPESLQKVVLSILGKQYVQPTPVSIDDALASLQSLKQQVKEVKQWWQTEQVAAQLQQAKLKKNTKLGRPHIYQSLSRFCQSSDVLCPLENGWQDLFPEKVNGAKSKASSDLSHLDFSRFEGLQRATEHVFNQFTNAFLSSALTHIEQSMERFKRVANRLTPDDLLRRLQDALLNQPNSSLANTIRRRFPAALVDEFQDTDQTQFQIFRQIYPLLADPVEPYCVVMIGDPKQAIYAFRGADIFTYIQAKREVDTQHHYTLDKNWRSSASLVAAVNRFFQHSANGFLFNEDIPFEGVKAAQQARPLQLSGKPINSIEFCHLTDNKDVLGIREAKPALATCMANQIVKILQQGQVENKQGETQLVKAGDICVLVRDRNEAAMVKSALLAAQVQSVFLIRQNVFTTDTAMDLYRLLDALVNPSQEQKVKAALASGMFCFSAWQLDNLFNDEVAWQSVVDQFVVWQKKWEKYGLMQTVNQVMLHFSLASKLVSHFADGARKLTDLRHLIELLQQKNELLAGESQLLYWFGQQLQDPEHANEGQQLRLESDANLVQIITMHASKGLEFPLVFIPFACVHRSSSMALYHDADMQLNVDFLNQPANLAQAENERLAEDIRLLYVAITRAVHYCFIGVWNPALGRSKQSALAQTAFGSLLLTNTDEPSNRLIAQRIEGLCDAESIGYQQINLQTLSATEFEPETTQAVNYVSSALQRSIPRNWRTTSYSAIAKHQEHAEYERPGTDEQESKDAVVDLNVNPSTLETEWVADRFHFPKGAQAGSFLHGVLENCSFHDTSNLADVVSRQSKWFGIDELWSDTVNHWIQDVLNTPIKVSSEDNSPKMTLAQLSDDDISVEMEFYLPLKEVQVVDFNQLVNDAFVTSQRRYQFEQLNGMLKGFIDLTFCYEGKFYVADYKSNFLGDDFSHYDLANMQSAMRDHDYHLQSLLYVLALHRLLRAKLDDYDYEHHIGGAHYWFLRGMSAEFPGAGCYFYKPPFSIVQRLDNLFSGKPIELPVSQSAQSEQMGLFE